MGIGTLNPQQRLHINGRIKIDTLVPTADPASRLMLADTAGVLRGVSGSTDNELVQWNNALGEWELVPPGAAVQRTDLVAPSGELQILNGGNSVVGNTNVEIGLGQQGAVDGEVLAWDSGTGQWRPRGVQINSAVPLTGDGSAANPLALQLENGLEVGGADVRWGGPLVDSTTIGQAGFDVYFSGAGQVGIGTTSPIDSNRFFVQGDSAFPTAIHARTDANEANSVSILGVATTDSGEVRGIEGQINTATDNAIGTGGFAESDSGRVYGVYGQTRSTSNGTAGVGGFARGTGGTQAWGVVGVTEGTGAFSTGVIGFSNATTGRVYGTYGEVNSSGNLSTGVIGFANATSGQTFGLYGLNNSSTDGALGAVGISTAGSGVTNGVQGFMLSTTDEAKAVAGYATGGGGQIYGVFGETNSPAADAAGVYGQNTNSGAGAVFGTAGLVETTNNNAAGIYGEGQGNALSGTGSYAGIFNGDLTASAKMFHIDNPEDPANSFLNHYSLESPAPNTLYSGKIQTDESGYAQVQLPSYFQSLNKDFRYNLTVMGTFAQAIVKEEIGEDNTFLIQTNKPEVKVSWTVIATRDDPYMQAYRRPAVQPKTGSAKGKYLHPEVHNQPESRAIYQSRNTVAQHPKQQPTLEKLRQRPQSPARNMPSPSRR